MTMMTNDDVLFEPPCRQSRRNSVESEIKENKYGHKNTATVKRKVFAIRAMHSLQL